MSVKAYDHLLTHAAGISPELVAAIAHVGPVKMKRRNDQPLGQMLCRAVAGQQLSVKAAETIWGRVLEAVGDEALMPFVASCSVDTFRGCGLSAAKAKAMRAIAAAEQAGELEIEELKRLDTTARTARLTSLWGVGQWTADMTNIFYFGDPDVWPDGDAAVRSTLESLTGKRRKTVLTAARFSPYRTYLAMMLWRYKDNPPMG